LLSPAILPLLKSLPPQIMTLLVALALLGPLMGALTGAFAAPPTRFAATTTLAVTASGAAAFGIGAAFWGLTAGLAIHALETLTRRP
jgi:benzoate membrane transport protein